MNNRCKRDTAAEMSRWSANASDSHVERSARRAAGVIVLCAVLASPSGLCVDAPVDPPDGGKYRGASVFDSTITERYSGRHGRELLRFVDVFDDVELGRRSGIAIRRFSTGMGLDSLSCRRPRLRNGQLGRTQLALYLDLRGRRDSEEPVVLSYRVDDGKVVNLDVGALDLSRSPLDQALALRLVAVMRTGELLRIRLRDRHGTIVKTLAMDIRGFAEVHDWVARAGCHLLLPDVPRTD